MNQIKAMHETIELMEFRLKQIGDNRADARTWMTLPEELQPAHLRTMIDRAIDAEPGEFSDAKLGRWLGWMQAAVVAMGLATLDDMKQINKANRDA